MDEQLKEDERFDASQYAFFGGAVSQEVELGGLDEGDEIALSSCIYEEDERSSNPSNDKEEVEALDTGPQLDGLYDISNISSSFRSLGLGTSSDPDIDQRSPNHSYVSQRQWEVQGGISQMPFPVARPHPRVALQAAMFHHGQQEVAASQENLFPGYRLPHVPLPIRGPLHPYSYCEASHAFFPPPPPWHLMPSNVQQGIFQGFVPGFSQHHMAQHYAALPVVPEALLQRQFGRPRVPLIHAQQGMLKPILSAHPFLASEYFDESDNARDLLEQQEQHTVRQQGRHGSPKCFRNATQQQHRSKYMTSGEIEGIARIQRAATQSNDPYVGDYYHQAVQAKTGAGTANGKHHFAPHQLRDLSFQRRALALQPTFVPVDGLGKVPFSSVRSPRPLLEVEDFASQTGGNFLKRSECPLEQEPMLAARIAIEDGLCRLLDVDDIDRFLKVSQPLDGGADLRRQRQSMLEELAVSLQLLEPSHTIRDSSTGPTENNAHLVEADTKDLVFLHIVSLPKGRKLLSRYLELLPAGSQLVQRVCLIIFRYLQFLFGVHQKDLDATAATSNFARRVASCAAQMNLKTLSACVGAVVSSPEQPAFRPFGSASGEGASLIMKSLLDRATDLLTDSTITTPLEDRKRWQATFDSFFNVLLKHCTNTFDRIVHTTAMSASLERSLSISEATAEKISKELPIELLRAILPHMNEQQRKALLDFTQRSVVKGASSGLQDNTTCNSMDEVVN